METMTMTQEIKKSPYLEEWKARMRAVVRMKYDQDQLSDWELESYLNHQIQKKLKDRNLILVNNYTNKVSRVTILQLIELIQKNHLICSGGGCLFLPHGQKENLLIEFILYIMAGRKKAKNDRKKFDKGTDEWAEKDREQLAFKLIINSLYGCLGYPGFIMFNIFLAEAITSQGRNIITSAINAIENFLGDSMWFESSSEVYHVIHTIRQDFQKRFGGSLSKEAKAMFALDIDLDALPAMCTRRFLKHCIFHYPKELETNLFAMFSGMSSDELILMYFKNNFMEFSRLQFIKEKFKLLILMMRGKPLMFCEDDFYTDEKHGHDPQSLVLVKELWDFYDAFVHYNHPIFDRLQKAMYLDKSKSLYTDTDSVFISLDEMVQYLTHEVITPEAAGMSESDLNFTAANVTLSIVNRMIDCAMKTLCASLGITPEFAKLLNMKNEFFFSRIMFTDVKKRYVSLAILQEGQLLNDGKGLPEIKGFDFKKAGTKPFVRDFYTNLCLDEILRPKVIDPTRIFNKFMGFKELMISEIAKGNYDFFKQANVKKPEHYAHPYSTQGVNAVLLWNALVPDKALEFPIDINVIPIRDLTWNLNPALKKALRAGDIKSLDNSEASPVRAVVRPPVEASKTIQWYKDTYPEAYARLYKAIYCDTNPLIQHMNLTSIAVPKNADYEIPEYVTALFDIDSVVNNAMSLGIPLLKSVGIQSFQASSNLEHVSNMVSL